MISIYIQYPPAFLEYFHQTGIKSRKKRIIKKYFSRWKYQSDANLYNSILWSSIKFEDFKHIVNTQQSKALFGMSAYKVQWSGGEIEITLSQAAQ